MTPNRQSGKHTWSLYLKYHRCPKCGFIIENRTDYFYQMGKYLKELQCPRCSHEFTLIKDPPKGVAPLVGKPQPVEWDWSSHE